nr:uncharacterized protein LOC109162453 [Ipomoea batatas]
MRPGGMEGVSSVWLKQKKLIRRRGEVTGQSSSRLMWYKKCWLQGIPWKMSFMAWRVFRNKVPTDDVLSRFGFNVVSRCFCCNDPKQCTLQHVFCTGDVAREVWTYFGQTLGVRLHMYGIRQVLAAAGEGLKRWSELGHPIHPMDHHTDTPSSQGFFRLLPASDQAPPSVGLHFLNAALASPLQVGGDPCSAAALL